MRVLYDYQIFERQAVGGISRYFCSLVQQFQANDDVECLLPMRFTENHHLSAMGFATVSPSLDFESFLAGRSFRGKWRLYQLRNRVFPSRDPIRGVKRLQLRALRRADFDVFHPTYYDDYFVSSLGMRPFVLTVYDMIHERFPSRFQRGDPTPTLKRRLVAKASHVICISEATRQDLMTFTGVAASRTSVVHLGTPRMPVGGPKEVAHLNPGFVLYVGERAGYKNFGFLVEAVAGLLSSSGAAQLVCAGRPFGEAERRLFEDCGVADRVLARSVSDGELTWLYQNAICLAIPSLCEGFGLTVLEAFSNGCPVVCSNAGSLPEVAEDAAVYFDPTDRGSAVAAMRTVLRDSSLRREMAARGLERARRFTWESTAAQTLAIYQRVARESAA